MCDPILVTLLKMQPHRSQSCRETASPSSGTSPQAFYGEEPFQSVTIGLVKCWKVAHWNDIKLLKNAKNPNICYPKFQRLQAKFLDTYMIVN